MKRRSITRSNRTLFVIAIDQSGSMQDMVNFRGERYIMTEVVALMCNEFLSELIMRARRDGREVRDYYDIVVVSYSGDGLLSLLGEYNGSIFIPVTQLEVRQLSSRNYSRECRLPNGEERIICTKSNRWIEPTGRGMTPMHEALCYIHDIVQQWCQKQENRDAYPPIIYNITDGVVSDSDLTDLEYICEELKTLGTTQGNILLVNTHLSSCDSPDKESLLFPTIEELKKCGSECRYLSTLFHSSSDMPEEFIENICSLKRCHRPSGNISFKGLGFNTSLSDLFALLNIGSISVKRA